mmetsp:Transcript_24385/g.44075  ORF Transcript_24385/g.44075 Transcript_24385/m.44075 type:complete len:306 (+) Transcript_24385:1771-2688(+)
MLVGPWACGRTTLWCPQWCVPRKGNPQMGVGLEVSTVLLPRVWGTPVQGTCTAFHAATVEAMAVASTCSRRCCLLVTLIATGALYRRQLPPKAGGSLPRGRSPRWRFVEGTDRGGAGPLHSSGVLRQGASTGFLGDGHTSEDLQLLQQLLLLIQQAIAVGQQDSPLLVPIVGGLEMRVQLLFLGLQALPAILIRCTDDPLSLPQLLLHPQLGNLAPGQATAPVGLNFDGCQLLALLPCGGGDVAAALGPVPTLHTRRLAAVVHCPPCPVAPERRLDGKGRLVIPHLLLPLCLLLLVLLRDPRGVA